MVHGHADAPAFDGVLGDAGVHQLLDDHAQHVDGHCRPQAVEDRGDAARPPDAQGLAHEQDGNDRHDRESAHGAHRSRRQKPAAQHRDERTDQQRRHDLQPDKVQPDRSKVDVAVVLDAFLGQLHADGSERLHTQTHPVRDAGARRGGGDDFARRVDARFGARIVGVWQTDAPSLSLRRQHV